MKRLLLLSLILTLSFVTACSDDSEDFDDLDATDGSDLSDGSGDTSQPPLACADEAPIALSACISDYGKRIAECYSSTGEPCADGDAELAALVRRLGSRVDGCADGDFGELDGDAVAGRLQAACESEASAVAWRTYGGPQGAVYAEAEEDARLCLSAVHHEAIALMSDSLNAIGDCVASGCDLSSLQNQREGFESEARTEISAACERLDRMIAVTPEQYVENTAMGVDCVTAVSRPNATGLGLHCGPSNAEFEAKRGEWSEIVVNGDKWGTQCGDGSEYAFWIRPAPEGSRLDRVVVALQGGGVCLFEEDCAARLKSSPELFNARNASDMPLAGGIASTDSEISSFSDWTMVYLPYCNQDVFGGGGVIEDLGSVKIPRYGAVNLRSSVQMVRDFLWKEMDAAGGEGFRSDNVEALFGGFSAGGYGTLYNYAWFLDELLWPKTTAFPDAGLAIDNGEVLGVGNLGNIKIPAWGLRGFLPPYCFAGICSGGETLYNAISPRLLQVPQQRMLLLSNQYDATQAGDAFFRNEDDSVNSAGFTNAIRQTYCDTRDLPGIDWYLTSVSEMSVHVVTIRDELWQGTVDGVTMNDFFVQAVENPGTLESHVEEGDFQTDLPGVTAFPCSLE